MRVTVLCFGVLREIAGAQQEMQVDAGVTVGVLLARLEAQATSPSEIWTRLAVAVNRVYAARETVLAEGDEVALLPPVSGGRGESARSASNHRCRS